MVEENEKEHIFVTGVLFPCSGNWFDILCTKEKGTFRANRNTAELFVRYIFGSEGKTVQCYN